MHPYRWLLPQSREKLDEELKKRYDSINARMVYSVDEVDILLAK